MFGITGKAMCNNYEASGLSDRIIPAACNRTCMINKEDINSDKKTHKFNKKIDVLCKECIHERVVRYFGSSSKTSPCPHLNEYATKSECRLKQCTENRESTVGSLLSSQLPQLQVGQKERISVFNEEADNRAMDLMKAMLPLLFFNENETPHILFSENTQIYNSKMNAFINIHIIETNDRLIKEMKYLDMTVFDSTNKYKLGYARIEYLSSVGRNVIVFDRIEVYKEYRGQYIGGSLMDTIINIAVANNIKKIVVSVMESFGSDPITPSSLHRFYKRHGFSIKKGDCLKKNTGVLMLRHCFFSYFFGVEGMRQHLIQKYHAT